MTHDPDMRTDSRRSLSAAAGLRLFLVASIALLLPRVTAASSELQLESVRDSLTGRHCRFRQIVDGIPTDDYVVRPCAAVTAPATPAAVSTALRRVGGRVVERRVEWRGLEPWIREVDPGSGETLRTWPNFFQKLPAASSEVPAPGGREPSPRMDAHERLSVPALVFDPNPVAALNDPALRDHDDDAAAVPGSAYESVVVRPLVPSGPLRGDAVALVDRQAPSVTPPDASTPLSFNREEDGFEDVQAFFHIERNQHYLRSLGYEGSRALAPYAIEVDAHALNGADNSLFLPSLTNIGRGTLFFGEGGTDDAEDADLLVHEYGHAILEWVAPGTFAGAFSSEARAFSEGFCDYWAFSAHYATRLASGRDPFCFADWDPRCWEDSSTANCAYPPGSDCLRRLDSTRTMQDYVRSEAAGTEHLNGMIFSSALREIRVALAAQYGPDEGRRIADTIALESLFDTPPRPTFATMGRQLLEADRLLYHGLHAATICAAMTSRGILASCGGLSRGGLTLFQSAARGVAIPDNDANGVSVPLRIDDERTIERVEVRVDIEHPLRGDLRIELIAPDGTTVILQQVGIERTSDVHATFGVDAEPVEPLALLRGRSAAGVWYLRVRDLRVADAGVLVSWGLRIRFAGEEEPAVRPTGATRRMIPVVAHLYGSGDTTFRSDVRLANPRSTDTRATLVFTPSRSNGLTEFASIDVLLRAGATVSLDDVVASAFGTTGSGSLEVIGEVVVSSRIRNAAGDGDLSQHVPANLEVAELQGAPLAAAGLPLPGLRTNLGVTETAGVPGIVRVEHGGEVADLAVAPFSHHQMPLQFPDATIRVLTGGARVVAYLSQVDQGTGDAMFVSALHPRSRFGIAPALSAKGASGAVWTSDLWFDLDGPDPAAADLRYHSGSEVTTADALAPVELDVVANVFRHPGTAGAISATLPPGLVAHTRIRGNGSSQYVPLLEPVGAREQHLVFVEVSTRYRTNAGIVTTGEALAEVIVYDAGGSEIERQWIWTANAIGMTQLRVPVAGGRAIVRFHTGTGRAWLSLVDNRTEDAILVAGEAVQSPH